ncbi:hypothetical protein NKG05_15735 [Oerskovia sp. M15]
MWWNFVGRSHDDVAAARAEWMAQVEVAPGAEDRAVPSPSAAPPCRSPATEGRGTAREPLGAGSERSSGTTAGRCPRPCCPTCGSAAEAPGALSKRCRPEHGCSVTRSADDQTAGAPDRTGGSLTVDDGVRCLPTGRPRHRRAP